MKPGREKGFAEKRMMAPCLLLAFSTAGCSLAFVDGPPATTPQFPERLECTTSRVLPSLDAVFGGARFLAGVASISFLGTRNDMRASRWRNDWVAAAAVLEGGFTMRSGKIGFRKVRDCRRMMREWRNQTRGPNRTYMRPARASVAAQLPADVDDALPLRSEWRAATPEFFVPLAVTHMPATGRGPGSPPS